MISIHQLTTIIKAYGDGNFSNNNIIIKNNKNSQFDLRETYERPLLSCDNYHSVRKKQDLKRFLSKLIKKAAEKGEVEIARRAESGELTFNEAFEFTESQKFCDPIRGDSDYGTNSVTVRVEIDKIVVNQAEKK